MTPVTAVHRQRLSDIRERTADARKRRAKARELMDVAREGGDLDAQAVAQIQLDEAMLDVDVAERLESQLLSSISGVSSGHFGGGIFDDPQTIETLETLGNGSFPIGAVNLGPLSSVEELCERINLGTWGQPKMAATGDALVPDSGRLGAHYGVVPQPRRRLSLLDLIPASPMIGRSFEYMQEGGVLDGAGGAAETAEGAVKPEADLALTEAEVVAKTIAVWRKLRRQQLADVPALADTIENRLLYLVLRRLENQILGGNGVGENILGIKGQTGIGDIAFDAAVPLTDLALDGVVATMISEAEPDAVAVNPFDWAAMLKATAEGSGQRLDSGGAFATPPVTMWGLPAVPSTALLQGEALVGAFGTCARLMIRESVNVRVSDSDQDDFVRNRVTTLAEGRFGLMVEQPSGFTLVHLEAAG